MFGWILAAAPHMGKVWLAVTVGHVFCMATGVYDGRPRYSAMLEPYVNHGLDPANNLIEANRPGTDAYYANPALQDR